MKWRKAKVSRNEKSLDNRILHVHVLHGSICPCIIPACLYDHDSCHAELVTYIHKRRRHLFRIFYTLLPKHVGIFYYRFTIR